MFWKRLLSNRLGMIGLCVIIFNIFLAVLAQNIATHDPLKIDLANRAVPPSKEFLFGTDDLGRDIFSRVVFGARISLSISFLSVLVSMVSGVFIGSIGGYFGGWIDNLLMRFMDALMAFPAIILAIAIVAVRGGSLLSVVLALGVVYTPRVARIIRGSVLDLKEKEFVEASVAMGNNDFVILWRHILPNCLSPLIVLASVNLAYAILAEAMLSFLGMGARPPAPSWGNILSDSRDYMLIVPWMTVFPGLAISLAVSGFNFFGDALRDLLDPRLK